MEDVTIYVHVFDNPLTNTVMLFFVLTFLISAVRWILDILP